MNATEKYLTPYGLFSDQTFEDFCSKLHPFYFKPEVPDDIVKSFTVIEHLLALGYYNYGCFDVAYTKALHTLDMALHLRFKELEPNKNPKGLQGLINYFISRNYLDTSKQTMDHLKYMRDFYSHPKWHTIGGILSMHGAEHVHRIINQLYEDVNIRKEGLKLANLFSKMIKDSNLDNFSVLTVGTHSTLLFNSYLLFINNKYAEPVYTLSCQPLFNFEEETETGNLVTPKIALKIVNPIFNNGIMTALNHKTKEKVSLGPIVTQSVLNKEWEVWKRGWDNKTEQRQRIYTLGMNSFDSHFYIPAEIEFQKM